MKNRKRKLDRMTFMIIPQSADTPLKLSLSRKTLQVIITLLIIITVATIVICFQYYNSQAKIERVNTLKAQNEDKERIIKLLNTEIHEIEKQQQDITDKQEQIKKMMGIKGENGSTEQVSRGGKGGHEYRTSVKADEDILNKVQAIKTTLVAHEYELDHLLAKVNNEKDYFRCVPNQWPVKGEITSPYGWRDSPFGGKSKSFHNGIDIANDVGTTIVAAADGKVVFAGWQPVYGKTVIIEHGYGFVTKYAHNSAFLVEEGDQVKKGEAIARLGNTGRSTGPHLHFTIMKMGQTCDPYIYLP